MADSGDLKIHVNIDALTIGDLETLEKPQGTGAMIDVLQHVTVGVDIRKLPISRLKDISDAIMAAIREMQDSKN